MSGHSRDSANRFSLQPPVTVISTEAAHGIIVSSAAEKSAFLPPAFAQPTSRTHFAFAVALAAVMPLGLQRG
jgi:hypothetical protein